ncbi:MAG: right-handed parallel beta-helix repeat-containing protein, partial [Chloroflexota bacterium]
MECLGDEARPIDGIVLYVSPDGDDQNPGTTPEAPLRTLAYALCNVRPGQTVRVMPGTYHETVVMGAFGNDSAPITIQGITDGARLPVLDGESNRTMGIGIVESVNVIIENLEFRNYTDEGLYVLVGSDILIRNNRFIGNGRASIDPDYDGEGFGLNVVGVRRVVIEGNEAAENGPATERVERGILGTGINTYELHEAIIRDNHSHHNIG